jgi:hypothetical protein
VKERKWRLAKMNSRSSASEALEIMRSRISANDSEASARGIIGAAKARRYGIGVASWRQRRNAAAKAGYQARRQYRLQQYRRKSGGSAAAAHQRSGYFGLSIRQYFSGGGIKENENGGDISASENLADGNRLAANVAA